MKSKSKILPSVDSTSTDGTIPFDYTEAASPRPLRVQHIESQLRRPPVWGVCLWWSDDLPCWVHPEDLITAADLVPSNRIFKRTECENFADRELGYSLLSYGKKSFRALPSIWLPIDSEGFEVGDMIEVKSQMGRHNARICTIEEVRWNRQIRRIEYFVDVPNPSTNRESPTTAYLNSDIQPAVPLDGHLNQRQLKLAGRARLG